MRSQLAFYRRSIYARLVAVARRRSDREARPGWNAADDGFAAAFQIAGEDGVRDILLHVPETSNGPKRGARLVEGPGWYVSTLDQRLCRTRE